MQLLLQQAPTFKSSSKQKYTFASVSQHGKHSTLNLVRKLPNGDTARGQPSQSICRPNNIASGVLLAVIDGCKRVLQSNVITLVCY